MDIRNCIAELLSEHDCVIIPGFGGFIGNYSPAHIDPVHHSFQPPYKKLLFNINLKQNDGLLANAVSDAFGTSYLDACKMIDNFAEECRQSLQTRKTIVIPEVGSLYSGKEGNIQFEQEKNANLLPDAFGLTPFISLPVSRISSSISPDWNMSQQRMVHSVKKFSLQRSLKWAAILALPVATAAVIGMSQYDIISSRYANNAGMLSSLFSRFSSASLVVKKEAPRNSPAARNLTAANTPVSAGTAEIINTPVTPAETPSTPKAPANLTDNSFAIIVGAFRMKENAENYVAELKRKGMQASIFDQSRTGLYRVTIGTFSQREEAMQLMASARSADFSGAWLLAK